MKGLVVLTLLALGALSVQASRAQRREAALLADLERAQTLSGKHGAEVAALRQSNAALLAALTRRSSFHVTTVPLGPATC